MGLYFLCGYGPPDRVGVPHGRRGGRAAGQQGKERWGASGGVRSDSSQDISTDMGGERGGVVTTNLRSSYPTAHDNKQS